MLSNAFNFMLVFRVYLPTKWSVFSAHILRSVVIICTWFTVCREQEGDHYLLTHNVNSVLFFKRIIDSDRFYRLFATKLVYMTNLPLRSAQLNKLASPHSPLPAYLEVRFFSKMNQRFFSSSFFLLNQIFRGIEKWFCKTNKNKTPKNVFLEETAGYSWRDGISLLAWECLSSLWKSWRWWPAQTAIRTGRSTRNWM